MDLLAELLEANIHLRPPAAQAKAHAREISVPATALRASAEAVRTPRTRAELLARVDRTVATSAQVALAALERLSEDEHFSDSDIRAAIPDQSASGRKGAPLTAPQAPAPAAFGEAPTHLQPRGRESERPFVPGARRRRARERESTACRRRACSTGNAIFTDVGARGRSAPRADGAAIASSRQRNRGDTAGIRATELGFSFPQACKRAAEN
jgi:hypothetical protein